MTVLYTNPPKNEPVAHVSAATTPSIVCVECVTVEDVALGRRSWSWDVTPVCAGEVIHHGHGNACVVCGKTVV